tara:strand:+ start:749 stop:931 length:183 start_codon:yes stop_codon:yes gene_type:complete
MVTWMRHFEHGRHPAIGAEVDELKKAGWFFDEKKKEVMAEVAPVVEVDEVKRRGRPHRGA